MTKISTVTSFSSPPRTTFPTNVPHCQRSSCQQKKNSATSRPTLRPGFAIITSNFSSAPRYTQSTLAPILSLPDGSTVDYDKLLLASSSSRRPPIPGANAENVHYLRTIDDAKALKSLLEEGSSLAIVGAGWIGLEVAAGARERGAAVTVVEVADVPLAASLGPNSARCSPSCTVNTASTCGWARR